MVDYLEDVCADLQIYKPLFTIALDSILYGTGYLEIQWDEGEISTEQLNVVEGMGKEYTLFTAQDLNKNFTTNELEKFQQEGKLHPAIVDDDLIQSFEGMLKSVEAIEGNTSNILSDDRLNLTNLIDKVKSEKGKPLNTTTVQKGRSKRCLGLKPLDPIYMRIRADAWNNEYGYIQWIAFPPAIIDTDCMICVKYHPQSWGYEMRYGVSQIMPLIKNNDLLMQLENDAATWIHHRAVPPLIVQGGGDPQHPYTTAQMTDLMSKLAVRNPASMFFIKSDVQVKEMIGVARNMNISWWLEYLMMRRYQALGVPPMMMGAQAGASRAGGAASEVIYQDFITRLQMLQEFISDTLMEKLFIPLLLANKDDLGLKTEDFEVRPALIWKPVVEEDRNMRSQRLVQMVQVGAITKNQLREELGFSRVDKGDSDYDKSLDTYTPSEPKQVPSGRPPKQSEFSPSGTTGTMGNTGVGDAGTRETEMTQPMKQETQDIAEMLKSDDELKKEFKKIIVNAKTEIDGGKSTSEVKQEALEKATDAINSQVVYAYMLGKAKANEELGKNDPINITKQEMPKLVRLKKEYIKGFEKIFDNFLKDAAND